ncbi:MAG: LTA synthase family protein [Flavobacteriales bacterium]
MNRVPRQILLLAKLLALALLLLHRDQWASAARADALIALFDRGLLFDAYVASWMLLLPALLLGMAHALGGAQRPAWIAARWLFTVPFLAMLLLSCADVPYSGHTNMRPTNAAMVVLHETGQALRVLVSTPGYIGMLALFLLLAVGLAWLLARLFRPAGAPPGARMAALGAAAPVLAPLFVGMRATADLGGTPLIAKDAYFSDTPFLSQLGANAAYSFLESFGHDRLELIDAQEAIASARRKVVLVESLSASRLRRYGHPTGLMPALERLMDSSAAMDRFFSSGMHTANGIFSSLYGLPPIGAQHPMMHPAAVSERFLGLPGILQRAGWHTCFITPGDARFDNLMGFLPVNGFDELVSEPDFPASDHRNSWGVSDHALFQMALRRARLQPAPGGPARSSPARPCGQQQQAPRRSLGDPRALGLQQPVSPDGRGGQCGEHRRRRAFQPIDQEQAHRQRQGQGHQR